MERSLLPASGMRAKYFILVIAAVTLVSGCFYRKIAGVYGKAYSKTVGRVLPSLPSGGGGGGGGGVGFGPSQLDMSTIAGVPQHGTPTVQHNAYPDAPTDEPAVDEPAYTPPPARDTNTTVTYTRTAAPTYPSS